MSQDTLSDVLRSVRGKLTCKVDDFDVEPVHGMEPFRYISARLKLAAEVVNLDVVNFLSEWLELEIHRDGNVWRQRYERGVPTASIERGEKTPRNGTRVTFKADGATLTSNSTLRFRTRDEVAASLAAAGLTLDEVRDAPDRPGTELVFLARR